MDTRRDFLKKAMMVSGAAGINTLPPSILKALSIDPDTGSTYLDAEHIVLLMQENRSFDHAFGTLRGVRGFNDPRPFIQPDKNKVWLQKSAEGKTYAPFRLDIKDTKITWMGSLPHSRESQTGARNDGRFDNWIEAKKMGDESYKHIPVTMGYYTRDDIPFYYDLADAFTVCDQHFCSALSPTDPNRLHFWSGTVRAKHDEDYKAYLDNDAIERGVEWRTFPEILEQNNISWKIYQNEISADGGFTPEEDAWLSNFGDNPLEYFNQYNVKLSKRYIDYLPEKITKLQNEIEELHKKITSLPEGKDYDDAQKKLAYLQHALDQAKEDQQKYTHEKRQQLQGNSKSIHEKAFVVNSGDPLQHKLSALTYDDDGTERTINIPEGDVLHQFRKDVKDGKLPTVSWLAAPETFSDHPSAPWFGSWYLSEVIDILTSNPDVWKKTIFILTYDENDGYFDHVPPFTAPVYNNKATGKVSGNIDTRLDYVKIQEDVPGPIGLGFRVPMVVASPWSRGGYVNSQVFDHTSSLTFLEAFLNKKFNKNIRETNITPWRRLVCGDLTSVFRKYNGDTIERLSFIERKPFIESIHKAKFKNVPSNYKALSAEEIEVINKQPDKSPYMPQQEKGIRPACTLPYELDANGNYNHQSGAFEITLQASKNIFREASKGSPFIIHAYNYQQKDFTERNFAVDAGDTLQDVWQMNDFVNNMYHVKVLGPNGFYREFKGDDTVGLHFSLEQNKDSTYGVQLICDNTAGENYTIEIKDKSYHTPLLSKQIAASGRTAIDIPLDKTRGWYDLTITIANSNTFMSRYAGRIETGKESISDPAMS